MNILNKITIRNLKLNKKRSIGTIIGIMLSVALICAVNGLFSSFKETLIKNSISGSGYYHIALNINNEQNNKIKLNKDIKDIYYTYVLGTYNIENIESESLTLYSLNKEDFSNLSYKIIDGTFPKNNKEILISELLANETNLKINDYIKLDGKKYKITGITYRRKNSTGLIAITTDDKSDDIWAYISLKNPRDYKNSFQEILNENSYDDIESNIQSHYVINQELLKWEVFAFSDSTISAMTSIISVVVIIIIIVSVFCIRNSFAISTTEKMKTLGMLSSIGATKKQIRKSVIMEGLILGLIGIPLGILCGIVADIILIKIVNLLLGDFLFNNIDGLVFKVSFILILLSILLGIITIYFSSISAAIKASRISPIDNLRNTQDVKINPKKLKVPYIINRIFKTGGTLAYKNLKRSKKKYRTTVISITISIFVFISMYYFVSIGFEQSKMYYQDYDYNVLVYLDYDYNIETLNKIRKLNNIKSSYLLYESTSIFYVMDKEKVNYYLDDEKNDSIPLNIIALDNASFKEYTKRLGLSIESVKDKGILVNELRYYDTKEKKEMILDRYNYKTRDIVNLENSNDDEKNDKLSIELASVTYDRPIGLENIYYNFGYLVVNLEYFDNLEFYPSKLMIDTDESNEVKKNIEQLDKTISVTDLTQQARQEKALIIVISIFLYGFIGIITLIGITNIFNTITSNMELRQKEFAMLKSIGMTKKEFNRMINLETLFYSLKSLIYGIILGIIGAYLIHLGFNLKTVRAFNIPIKPIIISILFVFIVVNLIMKYSVSKINKQNTIETIRKDNV